MCVVGCVCVYSVILYIMNCVCIEVLKYGVFELCDDGWCVVCVSVW